MDNRSLHKNKSIKSLLKQLSVSVKFTYFPFDLQKVLQRYKGSLHKYNNRDWVIRRQPTQTSSQD